MLNSVKSLKFEKSINFLNDQLKLQNNNKQLVLDIMKNLSMLINNASEQEKAEYQNIYDSANHHLENISNNINSIEKLTSNIDTVNYQLTKLIEDDQKSNKSKQYFIDTFSQIKSDIFKYAEILQELTQKINSDTTDLNEFINVNNFQYNFNSINNDDESNSNYEFTGFSIKDKDVDVDSIFENGFDLKKELENLSDCPIFLKDIEDQNDNIDNREEAFKVNINENVNEENNTSNQNDTVSEIENETNNNQEAQNVNDVNNSNDEIINNTNTEVKNEDETNNIPEVKNENESENENQNESNEQNGNNEEVLDNENSTNNENSTVENLEEIIDKNFENIKNNDLNKASSNTNIISNENIDSKISSILEAQFDNDTLLISEKNKTIYLPYKLSELVDYIESYPAVYNSVQDVVKKEFILPFDYFMKHPYKARFSETYNILRNLEGKGFIPSVAYSLNVARRYNLNPAVIAACKTKSELESYLEYLDSNSLENFNFFNILYEVNPL